MKAIILITGIALSLGLSTACAKTDSEPEAAAPAPVVNNKTAPAPAQPEKKAESQSSQGMRIPVDGSSLESFEQSLEGIKAEVTEAEYESLTHAINYLMVYDIGARRDRARLAQRLDGLTGEEILARVNWDPRKEITDKKNRQQGAQEDQ